MMDDFIHLVQHLFQLLIAYIHQSIKTLMPILNFLLIQKIST